MLFALLRTTASYRIIGMLHILAAIAAFGPLVVYPALHRAGQTRAIARLHMRLVFPALVLLWVLGMGLAGLSDGVYQMSQTWLSLSILVWVGLTVVSWFLIRPALTDASEHGRRHLSMGVGISHLLTVIGLALMIWQPGL